LVQNEKREKEIGTSTTAEYNYFGTNEKREKEIGTSTTAE